MDSGNFTPQKLLKDQMISREQMITAQYHQKKRGISFLESLYELNFVDQTIVTSSYKAVGNARPIFDLSIASLFPHHIKMKYCLAPLAILDSVLYVGTSQVHNTSLDDALKAFAPAHKVSFVHIRTDALHKIIEYQLRYQDSNLFSILNEQSDPDATILFIDYMLTQAIQLNASDIHFHPDQNVVRMFLRVDGILQQKYSFHKDHWARIISRFKLLSSINITESRKPQSGKFTVQLGNKTVDCRLSTHPIMEGESTVIRILDQQNAFKTLKDLGLSQTAQQTLDNILSKPYGMVVMTGPTGSGKTTTLYAMLQYFAQYNLNIMTLEDPVEYQLPFVRQTQVNSGGHLTYAEGIKSLMRQDPDVILVGEIRDEETAQMALRAAMTGHLVLTTLHSPNTTLALDRLVNLGVDCNAIKNHMNGILSQRLVRKVCQYCHSLGCAQCQGTGFYGRIALIESLNLKENLPHPSFADAVREAVDSGITTIDECKKHVEF